MFGKLGAGELILVLIIALVIFGPSKLPEIGKALGKSINEFKNSVNKVNDAIEQDVETENKHDI